MKSFSQKNAVVTGAASGIGRALAIALSKEGCNLALADIDTDGLQETKSLVNPSVICSLHLLNVSDHQAVYAFSEDVIKQHKAVHIVINNAGVGIANKDVIDMEYEDFEWLMGINFWGMVYGTKAFLPYLLAEEEAWLANVSSVFGMISVPTQSAYNSSKFAIRGFTEALRQEVAQNKLHISSIHPGGIKTNIVKNSRGFFSDNDREEKVKDFDSMAMTTPDKAARTIIKGMKRNKKRILVGPDAWVIDKIQRLFPVGYPKILGKAFRKTVAIDTEEQKAAQSI